MLIPIRDKRGTLFGKEALDQVRQELTERHGGVTAYSRAPAEGHWESGSGVELDDVVVVEVLVDRLDVKWWKTYRKKLEERFGQEEILMRAVSCRVL
jgi:hypothetical protein